MIDDEGPDLEDYPFCVIKDKENNICFQGQLVYMSPDDPPDDEIPHICVIGAKGESYVINKSNSNYDVWINGAGEYEFGIIEFLRTQIQKICYGQTTLTVFNIGMTIGIAWSSFIFYFLYKSLTTI